MLRKVEADIEEDILKQRSRAQRMKNQAMWTMAPNGWAANQPIYYTCRIPTWTTDDSSFRYTNLRGRYRPGAYLGEGPLPLEATMSLRDPLVESATQKYYWDESGRRHRKEEHQAGEASVLEEALKAIKLAAANSFVQSLDIKKVTRPCHHHL